MEVNPYFEQIAKERGFYSKELMEKISEHGSIKDLEEVPDDIKKIFVTSHDISPQWHIRMQAAFQKYVDNAVSKTINFPGHGSSTTDTHLDFTDISATWSEKELEPYRALIASGYREGVKPL